MNKKLTAYIKATSSGEKNIYFEIRRPQYESDNGATPWYAEIGLGTKPQSNLRFMIDTGTKNTWITSNLCSTTACEPHRKFNPSVSSTYQKNGKQETISFGAWGSMHVLPSKDAISLPDLNTPVEIEFDIATNYTGSQFQELICDGGIAIPCHIPEGPSSTLILNLLSKLGLIGATIAAFWYDPITLKGEVQFGGINPKKFKESTFNQIELKNFPEDLECWIVNLDSMNGLFTDGSTKNVLANVAFALDTGSSQFKGDPNFIDAAKKIITNNGQYPEVINSPGEVSDYPYPVIELVLNGVSYRVPPEKYFIRVSDTERHLAFHYLADCENELIVGSTFLESVYTVFDFDNRCICLAEPKSD